MGTLLPDGPIDTLGIWDLLLGTPDRVRASLDAVPGGVEESGPVVVVADGPLRVAADALVALTAGDRARVPVVVAAPDAVPGWSADGLVIPLADTVDPDVPARFSVIPALTAGLAIMDAAGALTRAVSFDAAIAQLARRAATARAVDGDSATLARAIGRLFPLVYGAGPLGGVAAAHWKQHVNLDAKAPAFATGLLTAAEAELSGWGQHGDVTRQVFTLVVLRHDHEPPEIAARVGAVEEIVGEVVHRWHEVEAEGSDALAQLLDLCFVGELVSYHLAQHNEIDPGPTGVGAALDRVARS